ncbi:MAG: TRAP transporter large permease [Proteobacteria bacterium]|nr:TRAP transporter large permease [Pseudomonadota bacterium]
MSSVTLGIAVLILLLFVMLFRIMPIGTAMALLGFIGFGYLVTFKAAYYTAVSDFYSTFTNYNFTVIPLFIFMGQILFNAGIGRKLYAVAYKWLGHLPGGLAIATIGGCAGFAAISGSAIATAATLGAVSLGEMRRYKYDLALATGAVAAGGTLGVLIPPSVTFIVYGILVEESIGKLFIAGILPGLLLTALFMLTVFVHVILSPTMALRSELKVTWGERIRALTGVGETLLLFLLVMGGLFAGFFTPTEAAAVGAFGALVITVVRREISWAGILTSFLEALRTSCMVMVIIAGATVFNHFIAVTKIPFVLADWIGGLAIHPMAVMGFIGVMYLIGGCVVEALPLILLTVPIFFPVVKTLGFDPIWFGVFIVVVGQIGMISPPVGINCFVVAGVAKDVPLQTIFRGVMPFILAMLVCTVILMIFPKIALILPYAW